MCPRANQPGRFFTTAKTQKYEFIEDISLGSPKSCPIFDHTETYKKTFTKNPFCSKSILKKLLLKLTEEYVSSVNNKLIK